MSRNSEVFLDRLAGRLSGDVDFSVAPAAETDLLAFALRSPGPTIEIDCLDLTFIDSAGVRMLEHIAARSGKPVRLVDLPRRCRRVFEILDLCETFAVDEAV